MKPDRVFLDANVLYSACHGSKGLERLWDLADRGVCRLLASGYVTEEARRNLESPDQVKKLDDLLGRIEIVLEADTRVPCPLPLPEKDRPVLMAAITARADYLLTGDRRHFGDYFGREISGLVISLPGKYLQGIGNRRQRTESEPLR